MLNAASGCAASADELRRQMRSAPASFLEGALQNPELTAAEMTLLLRNPAAPASLLQRIGRDHRWKRLYEVKKGLVRHPGTPVLVARGLIPHLYWRDLAEVADDLRLHPTVRRHGEQLLQVRLSELTVGERISLARVASRGLISTLLHSEERPVLEALLGNGKLVELDVVRIASREELSHAVLGRVANHPLWGSRHAVRMALVANPRTPIPIGQRLLRKLPRRDLARLARDRRVPKIVRIGAERYLASLARRRPESPGSTRG